MYQMGAFTVVFFG